MNLRIVFLIFWAIKIKLRHRILYQRRLLLTSFCNFRPWWINALLIFVTINTPKHLAIQILGIQSLMCST